MHLRRKFLSFALLTLIIASPTFAQEDQDELQRLQKSRAPKTLLDLKPTALKDEDNAMYWLQQAREETLAIDMKLAATFNFDEGCDDDFLEKYNQAIRENPKAYEMLFKAAKCKRWANNFKFNVQSYEEFEGFSNYDQMRSVARVLMYRSAVDLSQGRPDDSAKAALAILQLASMKDSFYGLRGLLVNSAIQSMGLMSLNRVLQQNSEVDAGLLESISKQLDAQNSLDQFEEALVTERVLGLQMLKERGVAIAVNHGLAYLKTMRLAIERCAQPKFERATLVEPGEITNPLVQSMLPSINQARQSVHRNLTLTRCLRVLLELRGQIQDSPQWNEIDVPATTKTDPVSGKPLVIKKSGDGWLIYGFGINGVDDGGDIRLVNDYGIGPQESDSN